MPRATFPSTDAPLAPHHCTATSNNIASNFGAQGKAGDAEPLHRKALGIREKVSQGKMGFGNHSVTGSEASRMPHSHPGVGSANRRAFWGVSSFRDGDLPFTNVLTEEVLEQALAALGD